MVIISGVPIFRIFTVVDNLINFQLHTKQPCHFFAEKYAMQNLIFFFQQNKAAFLLTMHLKI